MRRAVCVLLALMMVLSIVAMMAGCGSQDETPAADETPAVGEGTDNAAEEPGTTDAAGETESTEQGETQTEEQSND